MKKFRELMEKAGDTAVFTFGRFNPPTTGHEKLIEACGKQQGKNAGSKMYVYASQSNDPKKNPLPYAKKIAYMRKMYKKYAKNITTGKPRTAIEVAVELYNKGHKAIVMVVGSDRVSEFRDLLEEYNGVEGKRHGYYGFDNIEVVSAGERDPDAEGVSGMSASKMRQAASDGDFQSFEMGVPSSFAQRKELYRDVRKGMGIREERDMGDMSDREHLRDLYLTGKIWNSGDIIEAKGVTGHIIRKGTNYVSFADDDGKVHKCWIHEIELNEASALNRLKKFDKSRVAAGKSPIFTDQKGKEFVRMKKSGMMAVMNVPMDQVGKFEKKGYIITERNYAKEYANYQGTPEQIARRSSRNKARRVMGDKTKIGMDVGHKDNNPLNNDPTNLRNEVPSDNRREPRLRETADHRKDYDTFVKMYAQLNKAMDDASAKLKKFPRGDMGMTPDKVKSSPAYKKAKADYEKVSDLTKRFLKGVPKDFMKKNARSKKEEIDESISDMLPWLKKLTTVTHPRGMEKLIKSYAKKAMEPKYKDKPNMAAADVARQTTEVSPREFVKYINKLVDKGVLPKQLKAEYQIEHMSFKEFVEQIDEACWDGYKQIGMKKKGDKKVPNCVPEENDLNEWGEIEEVSEYQGRKVTLNKPSSGDVKKSKVYVKNEKGNVVKVNFGDPNMKIKVSDPARRKSFRARHNCENPGPKWMARYWSCKAW